MMRLAQLRKSIERKKGVLDSLIQEKENLEKIDLKEAAKNKTYAEQAKDIIHAVAQATQQELEYRISDAVSLGMATVFDNPYELDVHFEIKRNQTECAIKFKRGDYLVNPKTASGIGAVDIAAFCLQIAVWSISRPKTANILILDEPFKHLKGEEANIRAIELVKQMSESLSLQIIMVGDERMSREKIEETADKLFVIG